MNFTATIIHLDGEESSRSNTNSSSPQLEPHQNIDEEVHVDKGSNIKDYKYHDADKGHGELSEPK